MKMANKKSRSHSIAGSGSDQGSKSVFTISTQPRWSAIGMSSKRWIAACTAVQARASAQKSPDFAPTLRDSVFAGGLRRCLAGRANPRNSTAIAAVSRLASYPAKPLSRREEIVNTL